MLICRKDSKTGLMETIEFSGNVQEVPNGWNILNIESEYDCDLQENIDNVLKLCLKAFRMDSDMETDFAPEINAIEKLLKRLEE